jgi:hypothetical protein
MSAEDRRLSDSVARSVMRITYGVSQWDETLTVSDFTDFFRYLLRFCHFSHLIRPPIFRTRNAQR